MRGIITEPPGQIITDQDLAKRQASGFCMQGQGFHVLQAQACKRTAGKGQPGGLIAGIEKCPDQLQQVPDDRVGQQGVYITGLPLQLPLS